MTDINKELKEALRVELDKWADSFGDINSIHADDVIGVVIDKHLPKGSVVVKPDNIETNPIDDMTLDLSD